MKKEESPPVLDAQFQEKKAPKEEKKEPPKEEKKPKKEPKKKRPAKKDEDIDLDDIANVLGI